MSLRLTTKPDLSESVRRWTHFWNGELLDRPPVWAEVPRDDDLSSSSSAAAAAAALGRAIARGRYRNPLLGRVSDQLELIDRWIESTLFLGDAIPFYAPDLGPDQFAAFLGATLEIGDEAAETSWAHPLPGELRDLLPLRLDPGNATWSAVCDYARRLAEHGQGRYIVGMADLHSHADALSALRSPGQLCTDMYDCPDVLEQAVAQVRALYPKVYEGIFAAGRMGAAPGGTGTVGWLPLWCPKRSAVIQCDFAVFPSAEMFRRFVLPGIEQEADYLDHCFYHMDGVGQIRHLDDLLAVKRIDGIQWVPGAGQSDMYERCWRDLLKKCRRAGKSVIVYGALTLEIVRDIHRDLGPRGIAYHITGGTRREVDDVLRWLCRNS